MGRTEMNDDSFALMLSACRSACCILSNKLDGVRGCEDHAHHIISQ